MNYTEAREYIEEVSKQKGMVFGLDNMKKMLEYFGDSFNIPIVHVAGTNGKGSVCAFTANILMSAGYKVGTYNSPAVGEPLEIIRCNNVNISEADYGHYVSKIRECAGKCNIAPTAFEIETMVALLYFVDSKCNICVIEAGLGGTYDATNVISSTVVAAFVGIGMDHMHILGDTLEKITLDKSGIIKDNITVVTQYQREEVLEILREKCHEKSAKLVVTDKATNVVVNEDETTFDYPGIDSEIVIKQPGEYQVTNAMQAIEISLELARKGYIISEEDIRSGLENTSLPFRYERVLDKPKVIIDGAHNEHAVARLMNNIKTGFNNVRVIFLMGIFKDKDYRMVIKQSLPYAKEYITITPPNERALNSSLLAREIKDIAPGIKVTDAKDIKNAVLYILQNLSKDDIIVAFGSLSYLNEFKTEIKNTKIGGSYDR